MNPASMIGPMPAKALRAEGLVTIDGLILKLAQRCNLACGYCYMYEHADRSYLSKPAVMSDGILEHTIARAHEYLQLKPKHRLTITFHGGEPTLIGIKRFRRYAEMLKESLGARLSGLHIQTNGTLLDERWLDLFKELDVEVGISLDGDPQTHDRNRPDHFSRGSYDRVARGLQKVLASGISPSIITVVDPQAVGSQVYGHLRQLGIRKIDFLLPDVTHDSKLKWFPDYRAGSCGSYLISAFDAWIAEDNPQVSVRMFREMIRLIYGGQSGTEAIGNPTINYIVVDTDGNIQGNDSLRICEPKMCDTGLNVLTDGFLDLPDAAPLLYRAMIERMDLCDTCGKCPEKLVCSGGNMPHRYSAASGFNNPSVWCDDLMLLSKHIRERLAALDSD